MSRNGFADTARASKVARLLAALDLLPEPPTADQVAAWCSTTWEHLTAFANRLRPDAPKMGEPSVVTRAMVVEALRERERAGCLCFVPPSGPGVPHEAGCPRAKVVSIADARARRAS